MKSAFFSRWSLLAIVFLALPGIAQADASRPDHYHGKPAETLEQAVTNFRDANQDLARLLDGDLNNTDVAAIHETTYTLENALAKLQQELAQLAETLEAVHIASEQVDRETLKTQGADYLRVTRELEKLGTAKTQ